MNANELSAVAALWSPHVAAVALCSARLLPVAFLCPLLGGSSTPTTVKVSLVLSLSLFFHAAAGIQAPKATDTVALVGMALREILFGTAVGLVASLPFDAARIGGRFIELFRGSSAEAALPYSGTRESALGDGLYQLVVAMAATGAGFPLLLAGLGNSFGVVPLGASVPSESAALQVVALFGATFGTGLAVGGPVAALSLAIDGLLGLVARAVPQLNLQDTGAPLRILLGGASVWLGISVICGRLLAGASHTGSTLRALLELSR